MAGRLTLSWVNKDQALVPDDNGGYSWVERDDPRVTEVRLLHSAGRRGDSTNSVVDNLLIQGDSYDALHALLRTPEYAERYRGKVKLVYIDPPFNTGQAFEQYDDALEHSVWLGMMRERLLLIRELLTSDGSVWVHLDDAEMAYCRVLMDEIFGRSSFLGTMVWERTTSSRNDALGFSVDQDYILTYAKDPASFRLNGLPRPESANAAYKNPDNDPRGPWREIDYKVAKTAEERPNLFYAIIHPFSGKEVWPRRERVWAYGQETHGKHVEEDLLFWGMTGNYSFPKLKKFLTDASDEIVPSTFWSAEHVDTTRRAKSHIKEMFPGVNPFVTPKPERLMQRIIHIGTSPGDIVLDCFAGSGTTAATAHKMGRRWVAVELSVDTVANFTQPRLEKVVAGEEPGGITQLVTWIGGGGFNSVTVGPSLYERSDRRVLLADWAKGDEFARAVAAQLGFAHTPDGPFAGTKGRIRLAVVDGVVDDVVVRAIVSHLGEDEKLTIVAKATAPGAEDLLRRLSAGSRLLKAPRDLVRRGQVVR